jgi:FixJ family two-component response regulator
MLIDIRMHGMDGLALLNRLHEIGCQIPAIIMTGHGDVESARQAFRARAIDFLLKPVDLTQLMNAVNEAFDQQVNITNESSHRAELEHLLASLTPREKEVMDLVLTGQHNREIAKILDISVRTVEVHKTRVLTKLRAESVVDLVRLYLGSINVGARNYSRAEA